MRRVAVVLLALGVFASSGMAAESIAIVVLPSENVAKGDVALLQEAASSTLRNATSFEFVDVEAGGDASCVTRGGCLAEMAKLSGVDHLLVLVARRGKGTLVVEGLHTTQEGVRFTEDPKEVDTFAPEETVPALVSALVPRHGLRGFGGLDVRAPAGATVKVDGAPVPLNRAGPLGVPAGVHEIDVKLSADRSVLYRQAIAAGETQIIEVKAASLAAEAATTGGDGLRMASYGVFSAGAVAIAASLVFGGLARSSMNGLSACSGDIRDCSYMEDARAQQARGARFANVGNGLAILGGALMVSGGALFTFDALGVAEGSR